MLAAAVAACNRNGGDPAADFEGPEYVFVPEIIPLSDTVGDISTLVIANEMLYFVSWVVDTESTDSLPMASFMSGQQRLFSMNLDGTNITELENFTTAQPPEGAQGSANIQSLNADADGNLWVVEVGHFFGFELPEGYDEDNVDEMMMWQYQVDLGQIMNLRKLDRTGAELMTLDISNVSNNEFFWIRSFSIDAEGNIFIAVDQAVYVLDSNGTLRFRLEGNNMWTDQLVKMSDGNVAVFGFADGVGRVLRSIDVATRSWSDNIDVPANANNVFPGNDDFDIIFTDGIGLFGLDMETGESERIVNWIDSDINPERIGNITVLEDGRILTTNQSWGHWGQMSPSAELILLSRVRFDTLPERTMITLATVWMDMSLRSAIVNFNRTNSTYRIQVIDYSEFNTPDDWTIGLTRLTTEIISGRIPDILDVNNLPFKQYVARGLLENLYPFIDNDPTISRSDLMESVLGATEIDGGLYMVFPSFTINTLAGSPAVLGERMGWTMDELLAVLRENPQADMPMGQWMTRDAFLSQMLWVNLDDFVDWNAGTTNFNSDGFIRLLEIANTFPEPPDMQSSMMMREEFIDQNQLIAEGRQIMMQIGVSDLQSFHMQMHAFGGDVVFKGFPSENRIGNVLQLNSGLALTSNSQNKEGAWSFLRTLLTEDWQRANRMGWGLPTNRHLFNELLEEVMTPRFEEDEDGNEVEAPIMHWGQMDGSMIEIFAMTQDGADKVWELIDSVSGTTGHDQALFDIITGGAEDFFKGRASAQDAARVIQSRASILVSEQT